MQEANGGAVTNQSNQRSSRRLLKPVCDVYENEKQVVLQLDVPGADQQGLEITVEKGVLSVFAKTHESRSQGYELQYAEYPEGDYQRKFTLSDEIDVDRISAQLKDGSLKVVLPKMEKHASKRITVTTQ